MATTLDRANFERLYLFNGVPPATLNPVLVRQTQERVYPVSILEASKELWVRGIAAGTTKIAYLIRRGLIEPAKKGGEFQFAPHEIDKIAEYLEKEQSFTPRARLRSVLGLDSVQECEALFAAQAENPDVNLSQFVQTIIPADAESGVPGIISFRPMTKDERASREILAKHAK